MTNAEHVAHFQFVILALPGTPERSEGGSLIRHSTFMLRHFKIRVHMSRRRFSGGGFVVNT